MPTSVLITGTGTPVQAPGRAGPGVLVRHDHVALQFDAGRATALRYAEAGFDILDLTAVFLTHHHSDHLIGLADLLMTCWLEDVRDEGAAPLVIAPRGEASRIAEHILDVWQPELELRAAHTSRASTPMPAVEAFEAPAEPTEIARWGELTVQAVTVDHSPVVPSVGFRVDTPDGAVVISGDTAVCEAVELLSKGADVLVHEAFRTAAIPEGLLSDPEAIAEYHTDTVELGGLAARAGVGHVVLTHLIPPPGTESEKEGFANDLREGGFAGAVSVADDLLELVI